MMELFKASFLFCLVVCSQVLAISKEKSREFLKQILLDCKEQEGGSDKDLEDLLLEKISFTRESNCMIACSFETIGIVSSNQYILEWDWIKFIQYIQA